MHLLATALLFFLARRVTRGDVHGAIAEYRKELEMQPGNEQITAALLRAEDIAAAQH